MPSASGIQKKKKKKKKWFNRSYHTTAISCNMYVYVATMVIQGAVQSARIWYKTERPRNSLKIALFSSSLLGTANMLVENFYMV